MTINSTNKKSSFWQDLANSPLRLTILVIALFAISLSGGFLIGDFVSDDKVAKSLPVQQLIVAKPIEIEPDTPAKEPSVRSEDLPELPIAQQNEPEIVASVSRSTSVPKMEKVIEKTPRWKQFSVTSVKPDGRPMIAIVIDDVGLNSNRIDALLQLPEVMTVSFLPYATKLQAKVDKVIKAGHEIMLHLPMEPLNKSENPGPNALLRSQPRKEIQRLTKLNLNAFSKYVGINNHMGSGFTSDKSAMNIVLNILKDEGLLFLDSKTIGSSVGHKMAHNMNIPTVERDIFLDDIIDGDKIRVQLSKVEKFALSNGIAIAIGHPHRATVSQLKKWMPEAVARGFQFIPISVAVGRSHVKVADQ